MCRRTIAMCTKDRGKMFNMVTSVSAVLRELVSTASGHITQQGKLWRQQILQRIQLQLQQLSDVRAIFALQNRPHSAQAHQLRRSFGELGMVEASRLHARPLVRTQLRAFLLLSFLFLPPLPLFCILLCSSSSSLPCFLLLEAVAASAASAASAAAAAAAVASACMFFAVCTAAPSTSRHS